MTNLEPISVTTLRKYLYLQTEEVEKIVKNELPGSFGIIIDGCTEGSRRYIAIFATYVKDGTPTTPLLAIAPPFNEEDFSTGSQKAFIGVLDLFGRDTPIYHLWSGIIVPQTRFGNIVGHPNYSAVSVIVLISPATYFCQIMNHY
jgi:hypothetical protein